MNEPILEIKILDEEFSICKITDLSKVDISDEFFFVAKTDEEISLVCFSSSVPSNQTDCDEGWRAFRIEGTLDFSLTGILSKISSILAEKQIPVFAVSTFNTDYILVKKENLQKTVDILQYRGYEVK